MRRALVASSAKEASAVRIAKEVLAANSTIKASAASDVDVVEKNQIGGETPVLLIGSPMCQTFCGVITTMMRDANRVSEVKYKKFVEHCVRHLLGNAGRLFLHENLWDRWSRGLSFVKKMAESDGMHKTKSKLCRSQSTMCSPRTRSCFKSKSEYVAEELGMFCCDNEKWTKIHVKNVVMMVLRGLKREWLCEGDWFERSWQSCWSPMWWTASVWWCLTQNCCENRDRWSISWISWTCTTDVQGSGNDGNAWGLEIVWERTQNGRVPTSSARCWVRRYGRSGL